jgi:uncharacterized protein (TIGR02466 family)
MEDFTIFNSFIHKSRLEYDKKNELIELIKNNYKKNPHKTPKGWNCTVHSTYGQRNTIPKDLTKIIENKCNEFLDNYKEQLMIKGEYYLNNIWYNAYKGNQFQEPHTHGDSLFSGCYYLKFNKDVHHQTIFYNPNFDLNFSKIEDNPYFVYELDCQEDDIIFFPSSLKHSTKGIKNNTTDEMRITISFNVAHSLLEFKNLKNINNKKFVYN